jgi:hypothetical protein
VALLAIAVAFAAVVIAVVATGVAVTALSRANSRPVQAAGTVNPPPPQAPSSPAQSPAGTASPAGPAGPAAPSGDEEVPVPEQEPAIRYQEHELRIQPTEECAARRTVDVDEPRVGADPATSELSYGRCTGTTAQLDIVDGLAISDVPSPTATALDCLKRIRDAPINEPLTPVAGLTLCLATSRQQANEEGITRKVVRIAVRTVADDGTIVARVTAWDLPS